MLTISNLYMYQPVWHFVISCLGDATTPYMQHLAVWGVDTFVTHQTPWLEGKGVCGV